MSKQFILLGLFAVLLNSCAPNATQNVIVTSEVVATATLAATITPTILPTTTEIPAPTKDPNAPEGYTRYENGIYYLDKTEAGKTITYEYTVLQDGKGNTLYEGWILPKTDPKEIPLLDYSDGNLLPLFVMIDADVAGATSFPFLAHRDDTSANLYGGNSYQLMPALHASLFERFDVDMTDQQAMLEFRLSILNGTARLPFISSTGEHLEGKMSQTTGFVTIVVPFDSLVGDGVSEWVDIENVRFMRSKTIGVDIAGNIVSVIASPKPLNELIERQHRQLAMFFVGNLVGKFDQTKQGINQQASSFTTSSGVGDPPHIAITPGQ